MYSIVLRLNINVDLLVVVVVLSSVADGVPSSVAQCFQQGDDV